MMRRLGVAYAILLFGTSGEAAATFEPIGADQLNGRKFVAEQSNMSIEAPGDNWTWFAI
jgi:hypothetical protein